METIKKELLHFIQSDQREVPDFYRDCFKNYLAVAYQGAHTNAVEAYMRYACHNGHGNAQPIHRDEKLSLIDCVAADCLSSAIQAYDDIHFATTTHPCGPVASVILGIARINDVTVQEALIALMKGMEIECRMAMVMLSKEADSAPGWYPTGIAGGIGAAVAGGLLCHFSDQQMLEAMALAASYASGVRGTHGSMAGSFVPSMAAEAGLKAVLLIKEGFTCHDNALFGHFGLLKQIANKPQLDYLCDYSTLYSMSTSCKPYPLGFISFAPIDACKQFEGDYKEIQGIIVRVSPRVYTLGKNDQPQSSYDGLVSLPYIIAKSLVTPQSMTTPLTDPFMIDDDVKTLMAKIHFEIVDDYTDDQTTIIITMPDQVMTLSCEQAPGSALKPMSSDDVDEKCRLLLGGHYEMIASILNCQSPYYLTTLLDVLS